MNIDIVQQKCCGCRTCAIECPINAIDFVVDGYGFEYPIIDEEKCVECGKCVSVCPALHAPKRSEHTRCGAALATDSKILKSGSSGGLFALFAQDTIKKGGVVYGAALDENLKLKTVAAKSLEELVSLYKSKYFLCDTDGQFENIKKDLDKGKAVLYCSSPCQVTALKLYLKKEYENLLTVDFVCHGVGSQALFDKSIQYIESKRKIKILNYSFRFKKSNASSHYYYYNYVKNGREGHSAGLYLYDPYYTAYQKRLACRDCCYDCHFASEDRVSDITIGDFHAINKYYPSIDRFAGVSMFVCNTQKGCAFFDTLSQYLVIYDMPWFEIVCNNRFQNTEAPSKIREEFLEMLKNDSFEAVVRKYLRASLSWKNMIYYHSPKFIRKIALKLIRR